MNRRTFLKGTAASVVVLATAGVSEALAQAARAAREHRLLTDPQKLKVGKRTDIAAWVAQHRPA
jgi:FtsP/CotA-like multicopper oxidase with cupredoxin domain